MLETREDTVCTVVLPMYFYSIVPDAPPTDFGITTKASHPETLVLTWRPVQRSHQNGKIVSYTISCGGSIKGIKAIPELEETGGMYSQELSGLKPGIYYSCQALARTGSGDGPAITVGATTGQVSVQSGL